LAKGLAYRSIFPESHFRTTTGSDFSRVGSWVFYENWVLPRLLDLAMRNQVIDAYRRRAIESAHGLVLEIGVGSGLNLSLCGPAVEERLRDQRFRVKAHCYDWFDEYRGYHRKEGKIIKIHDDLMSATRMVVVQIRSARIGPIGTGSNYS